MIPVGRWLSAGLVFAAGAIHLYLYFDYFHKVATIGPLFLLNAAAAVVVASAIVAWDHVAALVAGLLYAAGTLAAFFVSVAVGMFGFHERLRGPWQERAGAVELLAVLLLLGLIAVRIRRSTGHATLGNSPMASA
ncbi:MAG: hypothetical protein QOG33_2395 [Gaiellales bacterium]|jgi:hypothetical protein|nr:hypothetical protein [Gaiellales bacterium]